MYGVYYLYCSLDLGFSIFFSGRPAFSLLYHNCFSMVKCNHLLMISGVGFEDRTLLAGECWRVHTGFLDPEGRESFDPIWLLHDLVWNQLLVVPVDLATF